MAAELLINIDVPDLEAATRFYVEVLELRVGRRLGGAAIELLGAAVPIYLLLKAEGSAALPHSSGSARGKTERSYHRHWTPVHIDISVTDIDRARDRALLAGARAEGPVSDHAWGRMALMADPFGHGFCLLQFNADGYDAIAG